MNQPIFGRAPAGGPVMAGVSYCSRCGGQLVGRVQRCPRCGTATPAAGGERRSKLVAALLAFFVGGIGGHKFYLGRTGWGVAYLLLCCTGIPGVVALVEFILLLVMSEEEFQRKYPGAPPSGWVIGVLAIFPMIAIVGILAAIAIPNFVRYQLRAKASATVPQLISLMNAEVTRANGGKGVLTFEALPAGLPGTQPQALNAEEQALASELGWELPTTYAQFRVAVNEKDGHAAASFCAETDLDGDGRHAAVVGFLPMPDGAGGFAVEPPPAPCTDAAVIGPDGVAFRREWSNKAVPVSPPDVF